jgi:LCP family protein required for cell wall assembly
VPPQAHAQRSEFGTQLGSAPPGKACDPKPAAKKKRHVGRWVALSVVAVLLAVLSYPLWLINWASGLIQTTDALSGARGTVGTTFLLAGTDTRTEQDANELGLPFDGTPGSRADSIMILHRPTRGTTALISIPRDTAVEVPGRGIQKINAAYAFGGPELLVQTVEGLTGLTIDHYVEIGMGGLGDVVNAVGGIDLCMDRTVDDWESGLVWQAGCHHVDGRTALAFARMRMSDPTGDIGRGERQRQVIAAIVGSVVDPSLVFRPSELRPLVEAGLGALTVDAERSNIFSFITLAFAFRDATGDEGISGAPPISSTNFRPGNIGAAVQLDPPTIEQFWLDLRDGNLTEDRVNVRTD